MASKAWYKPSALPQLVAKFDMPTSSSSNNFPPACTAGRRGRKRRTIEVWTTTCIVTNFGMSSRRDDAPARRDEERGDGSSSSSSSSSSPPPRSSSLVHLPLCSILINPSNTNLTGPYSFPYFPRGGPQPKSRPNKHPHHIMGYVSMWGGMDVGGGMLFSAETVDGLVHQLGGPRLRAECSLVVSPPVAHNRHDYDYDYDREICPVGTAVSTSPGGIELRRHYDEIIHTTPPFYDHPPPPPSPPPTPPPTTTTTNDNVVSTNEEEALGVEQQRRASYDDDDVHARSKDLLGSCYRRSFELAFRDDDATMEEYHERDYGWMRNALRSLLRPTVHRPAGRFGSSSRRVAVPLLGAGCRAFPKDVAIDVAASEGAYWLSKAGRRSGCYDADGNDTVVFGLLEREDAEDLSAKLKRLLLDYESRNPLSSSIAS